MDPPLAAGAIRASGDFALALVNRPPDSVAAPEAEIEVGMTPDDRPAQLPALTSLPFIAALSSVVSHSVHEMTVAGNPPWYTYFGSLSAFG